MNPLEVFWNSLIDAFAQTYRAVNEAAGIAPNEEPYYLVGGLVFWTVVASLVIVVVRRRRRRTP